MPQLAQVSFFGSTPADARWLPCDGAAISRATYSQLFGAIGVVYGTGNGTTTFNVPNMSGRSPMNHGVANGGTPRNAGELVGENDHTIQVSELANHSHNYVGTQDSMGDLGAQTDPVSTPAGIQPTDSAGIGDPIPWLHPCCILLAFIWCEA